LADLERWRPDAALVPHKRRAVLQAGAQAEGKPVDARSDIFSFGVVLYEMVTGRRLFQGETQMATLAAILNTDPPPIGETAEGLPRELERIISCLPKDRNRRTSGRRRLFPRRRGIAVIPQLAPQPGLRELPVTLHRFG
jgi:serine/threonine protein kinase